MISSNVSTAAPPAGGSGPTFLSETSEYLTGAGEKSILYDVPANSSLLLVFAFLRGGDTATTAKCDGSPMDKVLSLTPRDSIHIFSRFNPTPGTSTVSITDNCSYKVYCAMAYSGCGSIGETYTSYSTTANPRWFDYPNDGAVYVTAGTLRNVVAMSFDNSVVRHVNPPQTPLLTSLVSDTTPGGMVNFNVSASALVAGLQLNGVT